jgi:hypothetical protein
MSMLCPLLLACAVVFADPHPPASPVVLVVVGAAGELEYGEQFRQWAGRWEDAARRGAAEFAVIGLAEEGETSDREHLETRLAEIRLREPSACWLILMGHGTFDGKVARFNLRGPDVSATEMAGWLKDWSSPLAVVNCSSCSGPFINALSAPGRIVVTATKSGHEHNFSRFGDYLSRAIADPSGDLDKDDQVSLLEAWLLAASRVQEFYDSDGRLASEHPLLDDNGDRLGTPADWFKGARAVKSPKAGGEVDGAVAARWNLIRGALEIRLSDEARARRDALEAELAQLRDLKSKLAENEYLDRLEPLLVEIARLYEASPASP